MIKGSPGFQTSLACLQHPLTLLSMAVLLLNDHVLKAAIPSWFTGKLSDFAGLFFFPFIVAAGVSLLLMSCRLSTKQTGYLAFGLVGIWFIALKTFPAANDITGQTATIILGRPSHFALDPTDLIALSAMLPAWALWNRALESSPKPIAYAALLVAAIAAMATSPRAVSVYVVTDLGVSPDGTLYAADKYSFGPEGYPVAVSHDQGTTWELSYSQYVEAKYIDGKIFPVEYCKYLDYYEVTHCYRVTATGQFQYGYQYRRDEAKEPMSWGPVFENDGPSVKAYDMMVIPCKDRQCIYVAIGEGGIFRRVLPYGNWELLDILGAGTNEVFSNDPSIQNHP